MNVKCFFVGISLLFAPCSSVALAADQDYPSKAITLIVPVDAGSSSDGIARRVMPMVAKKLGQQIVIENEGGAASIPGTARAAQAQPDGYTLLFGHVGTHAANPNLYNTLPYDPQKDFVAVARIASVANILAVPQSSPAKTVAELVELSKSAGPLRFASAGIGSSAHLGAELLALRTGAKLRHIPYKGGPQPVLDLMRGEVDMMFYSYLALQPGLQADKVRLIASASPSRTKLLPELPTVKEQGADVVMMSWFGIYAPAGTDPKILERLSTTINEVLKEPDLVEGLIQTGVEPYPTESPEQFQQFSNSEQQRYRDIIESANIPKN